MKLFFAILFTLNFSLADEGGNSFWFCGQFASLLAVPKTVGWAADSKIYYQNQKDTSLNTIVNNQSAKENIHSKTTYLFLEPSYTPSTKWFGGQPSFTLPEAVAYNFSKATISYDYSGTTEDLSQNIWGISNMYPFAEIAWDKDYHNWMVYFMGAIPLGNYNPNNLSNFGTGHYAVDLGFGYTYLNKISGMEASALFGVTYNFVNPQTDYKNGLDSHLDYGVSKFLSEDWELGVVGYVYYQLTADNGNLGPFKSKAAALGAEGTYFWKSGEYEMNFNLRGYYDFWTENRLGGFSMYAVFTVQFPNKG
ncbi:MAG: transporter [Bacteriovoracales bacterium]